MSAGEYGSFFVEGALKVGDRDSAVASALLELESTAKGFLPPRMTEAQRDAISSPATGLIIYNTDTNQLNQYTSSSWSIISSSSSDVAVTSKTTTYTADPDTDDVILCDTTSGAFTVTLPAASGNTGKRFWFKKTNSGTAAVTIDGDSAETIDGKANIKLYAQYDYAEIICDGTNWVIVSKQITIVCHATRTTNQTGIVTSAAVVFNVASVDTAGGLNTGTGAYTYPESGIYKLTTQVAVDNVTGVDPYYELRNGGTVITRAYMGRYVITTTGGTITSTVIVNATAGQNADVIVSGDASFDVIGANGSSYMTIEKIN